MDVKVVFTFLFLHEKPYSLWVVSVFSYDCHCCFSPTWKSAPVLLIVPALDADMVCSGERGLSFLNTNKILTLSVLSPLIYPIVIWGGHYFWWGNYSLEALSDLLTSIKVGERWVKAGVSFEVRAQLSPALTCGLHGKNDNSFAAEWVATSARNWLESRCLYPMIYMGTFL